MGKIPDVRDIHSTCEGGVDTFEDAMTRPLRRDNATVHHAGQTNSIISLEHNVHISSCYIDRAKKLTISINSCTSPTPSVRILPISSETNAPRASRCTNEFKVYYHSLNGKYDWEVNKKRTLEANSTLICLRISPLLGAGTDLKNSYASLDFSSASCSSFGVA